MHILLHKKLPNGFPKWLCYVPLLPAVGEILVAPYSCHHLVVLMFLILVV